jgi:Ca2+-binding EF-hand superfamily protein
MRLLLASVILVCSACTNNARSAAPMTQGDGARRMFNALDTNKDGKVSHQEWAVWKSRMVASAPEEQRQQFVETLGNEFKKLDSNGDGSFTFAEMQANNKPSPCPGCTQITPGWVPLTPRH